MGGGGCCSHFSSRSGIKVKRLMHLENASGFVADLRYFILIASWCNSHIKIYYCPRSWSAITHKPSFAVFKAWVNGRSRAGIAVSVPVRGMFVSCERCELSGIGLCVGLITRPEDLWCVCNRGTSQKRARSTKGCRAIKKISLCKPRRTS
jgi:hypothetical protein